MILASEPPGSATVVGKNKPRPAKDNPKLRAELRALVPADAEESFNVETEIVESTNAAEAIRQAAEQFDADAICVGWHGRSGALKTLLGGGSSQLMAKSERPVLVVRSREQ